MCIRDRIGVIRVIFIHIYQHCQSFNATVNTNRSFTCNINYVIGEAILFIWLHKMCIRDRFLSSSILLTSFFSSRLFPLFSFRHIIYNLTLDKSCLLYTSCVSNTGESPKDRLAINKETVKPIPPKRQTPVRFTQVMPFSSPANPIDVYKRQHQYRK